jgi:hypothetical protein
MVLAAGTILVMSLIGGWGERADDTRGPLWHAMLMGSFIVVLASVLGSLARRLSKPRRIR